MLKFIFSFFFFLFSFNTYASCINPFNFSSSIVNITGHQTGGTAWFMSPSLIVTVAHVIDKDGINITFNKWSFIHIKNESLDIEIKARLKRQTNRISILELDHAITNIKPLSISDIFPSKEEEAVTLGYPFGKLTEAGGRYVKHKNNDMFFELFKDNNRLAVDHGSSGAPIFNCEGKVIGVTEAILVNPITLFLTHGEQRIPPPWGHPNVIGIHIPKDF
jgi:S1-C subfamily serine protease